MLAALALLAVLEPRSLHADSGERAAVTFAPTRATLLLITGAQAQQALSDHRPAAIDADSSAEADLLRACANGESQRSQITRGFFLSAAAQVWQILMHPLAVSVHDELLKYARVSAASAGGDYYRGGDTARSAPLASRISCLRFTRYANDEAGNAEVALDFVAGVLLDAPRDAIRLRPLRLYLGQADAKSANGHYCLAISVRANAVWRDEYAGHQAQLFEQQVASESIDLKPGAFLRYYPNDAAAGVRVPIVPISFGVDRSQDFGAVEFAVSVAELGTPPATLKLLAEMLPDPDQNMSRLVVAAALAGAHLE